MRDHIKSHQAEIAAACQRFGVSTLELFGSASTGTFVPGSSDIDFLVEFTPHGRLRAFDNYFGLKEVLADLLGQRIDLVTKSSIRNPIFRLEVQRTAETIYADVNYRSLHVVMAAKAGTQASESSATCTKH